MPVLVVALVALAVAGAVAAAARRWPHEDPAAPGGRAVAAEVAEQQEAATMLGSDRLTILGLGAAAAAAVGCGVLLGVLFLLIRTRTGYGQLDIDLGPARWAARHATPASTSILQILTHLGSTALALPLAVAISVVEHRRLPNRAIFGFLALVEGGELLLVNLIKVIVGRARPEIDQLAGVSSHSFPSGHTATAAATFVALALLLGRGRGSTARVALAAAAAGLTALVAATRVLLGVHWLTDVLAGAALGWGWAAVCSIAFGGRLLRFGAPVDAGLASATVTSPPPATP